MTAIACIIDKKKIHLFSDGCAVNDKDEAKELDFKKIERLNNNVAVLKAGYWNKTLIDEGLAGRMDIEPDATPFELAKSCAEYLEDIYHNSPQYDPNDPFYNSRLILLGFSENDIPECYVIESKADFKVEKINVNTIPFQLSLITDETGRPPFHDLTDKYFLEERDLFKAGKKAFIEMVQMYKDTGKVGGKVFTETISID